MASASEDCVQFGTFDEDERQAIAQLRQQKISDSNSTPKVSQPTAWKKPFSWASVASSSNPSKNSCQSAHSTQKNHAQVHDGSRKTDTVESAEVKPETMSLEQAIIQYSEFKSQDFELKDHVIGFYNEGDTCFFNSSLQMMLNCTVFRKLFHLLHLSTGSCPDITNMIPLTSTLASFYHQYESFDSSSKSLEPSAMSSLAVLRKVQAMNSIFRQSAHMSQHDAEELLTYLIGKVDEEMRIFEQLLKDLGMNNSGFDDDVDDGWQEVDKGRTARVEQTEVLISKSLQSVHGIRRSVLHIKGSKPTVRPEPFVCLPLDIQHPKVHDLISALYFTLSSEGFHAIHKTRSIQTTATRSWAIETLPRYFFFQFKRFVFQDGRAKKVQKHVNYPTIFQVPTNICTQTLISSRKTAPQYRLLSVIVHHGSNVGRGHYTTYLRKQDQWYHADDARISFEVEPNVLCPRSGQCYLLCYESLDA